MTTTSTDLVGRTALVTGGSRGIGRATCLMLAECGAQVAINYTQNKEAAKTALGMVQEIGAEAMIVRADVSSEVDVKHMLEEVRTQLLSLIHI